MFGQLVEEIRELLHQKGVGLGQAVEDFGLAVVMREIVPRLGDADLFDRKAVPFGAAHVGHHARHVGA